MLLTKCPKEQEKYLKSEWHLPANRMPEMLDKHNLIGQIIGMSDIRLDDYIGDNQSFIDDCYLSITASARSKEFFQKLVYNLEQIRNDALQMDYFELAGNLTIVLEYVARVVAQYNKGIVDIAVSGLIAESLG